MMNEQPSDIFVRLHVSAYHSGLMGALGVGAWQLLCALAVHMDEHGICYPTHETLAARLTVHPRTIGNWMKTLLQFRWQGKPIVTGVKRYKADGSGHYNYVYTIHPISHFSIFGAVDVDDEGLYAVEVEMT